MRNTLMVYILLEAAFEVAALPKNAKVEIERIAIKK